MTDLNQYESSNQTKFIFGIPLRAKAFSKNWDLVCKNLEKTLCALSRQTDKDFIVYIAAHDMPKINYYNLDVRILIAPFSPPKDISGIVKDKSRKKRMIGAAMRKEEIDSMYFMYLDADDLVDASLVETVRKDHNKCGYLLERGYIFDVRNKLLGICDENRTPFYRHCGSCAIMYFKNEELPLNYNDVNCYYSRFKNHQEFNQVAKDYGRPLKPFEKFMAVYMVNHGENNKIYKGEGINKVNYVKKHSIKDKAKIESIMSQFPELKSVK